MSAFRTRGDREDPIHERHLSVRPNDVHVIGLHAPAVVGIIDRERRVQLEQAGQLTVLMRREVLDDDDREARTRR